MRKKRRKRKKNVFFFLGLLFSLREAGSRQLGHVLRVRSPFVVVRRCTHTHAHTGGSSQPRAVHTDTPEQRSHRSSACAQCRALAARCRAHSCAVASTATAQSLRQPPRVSSNSPPHRLVLRAFAYFDPVSQKKKSKLKVGEFFVFVACHIAAYASDLLQTRVGCCACRESCD